MRAKWGEACMRAKWGEGGGLRESEVGGRGEACVRAK